MYQDDCPLDPLIPDFLIVLGSTTLCIMGVTVLKSCAKEDGCWGKLLSFIEILLYLFFIAWTCSGKGVRQKDMIAIRKLKLKIR